MTVAQDGGDGLVTTRDLTALADPLNRRSALILGESWLIQIKLLPGSDAGATPSDDPPVQPTGGRCAEPAISVEDQNRE
jgi:hypothetical protein